MTRTLPFALAAAAAFALSVPAGSHASEPPQAAEPAVAPEALQALQRMGAYLARLEAFEVHSENSLDLVTTTDQLIDLDGMTTYKVRRPNAFVIENTNTRRNRRYIYNGVQLTVYAPTRNVYATVPAPGTIGEVLDALADRGIEVPLEDLFRWGEPGALPQDFSSAYLVGPATVNGVATEQWAFREGDIDWQIWIEQGERPLPRKIVIVDRMDPALPKFSAELNWNVNPSFDDNTFAFAPDTDDAAIQFASVE